LPVVLSGEWNGKGAAPELTSCSNFKHLTYEEIKGSRQKLSAGKLVFTYGVEWRRSEVHWASRWDIYLTMNGAVPDKVGRDRVCAHTPLMPP
jgi:transmembrane 9 superfamily protein 2/4